MPPLPTPSYTPDLPPLTINDEHRSLEVRMIYHHLQLRVLRILAKNYPETPPEYTSAQYRFNDSFNSGAKIFHVYVDKPVTQDGVTLYPIRQLNGGLLYRGSFIQCSGHIIGRIQPIRIEFYSREENYTVLRCTSSSYQEYNIIVNYRDIYWTMQALRLTREHNFNICPLN
jgi:hypothetical protein